MSARLIHWRMRRFLFSTLLAVSLAEGSQAAKKPRTSDSGAQPASASQNGTSAAASHGTPQPTARDGTGIVDLEMVKFYAMYCRDKYLVSAGIDVGVQLGFQRTAELTGPDITFEQARSLYVDGHKSRVALLAEARQAVAKRQTAIDKALGTNKRKCEESLRTNPYWRLFLFDDLLRIALDQLRLPVPTSEATAQWIASRNGDLEQEQHERMAKEKSGEPIPPARDEASVGEWQKRVIAHTMKRLNEAQRKQVVRAWPLLYPEGPAAPATDDAAWAAVEDPSDKPRDEAAAHPTTKPAPEKKPEIVVTEKDLQSSADWQELLPLVDVQGNAISCEWKTTESGIENVKQTVPHAPAVIGLPVKPTGSYELEFTFERKTGNQDVAVEFPVGDATGMVRLGHGDGHKDGELNYIMGTGAIADADKKRGPAVERIGVAKPHDVRLRVVVRGENAVIQVMMDKRPLLNWSGPWEKLKTDRYYGANPRYALGLGAHSWVEVEFSKVRIRPLSGGKIQKIES